jgi:regulator of protease activity HflC (stomatin/prohibitin superfamily)
MVFTVIAVIIFLWLSACLNVLKEWERAVTLRLGRLLAVDKGPGLIFILWPIDKIIRVSLRQVAWEMPPQDVITRDNVSVKVNAVVFFRVMSAQKAIVQVQDYRYQVEQAAQTCLRSVLGEVELDDLLSQREKLNERTQTKLDVDTEPWGVKVTKVEVKQVDLPQDMQRAIARQAEAERERRAKIINADAEYQASEKLSEAASILAKEPITITLRYLQTLAQIGTEKNTTIVFPIPIELLSALLGRAALRAASGGETK